MGCNDCGQTVEFFPHDVLELVPSGSAYGQHFDARFRHGRLPNAHGAFGEIEMTDRSSRRLEMVDRTLAGKLK
jgi:hypothetical protein